LVDPHPSDGDVTTVAPTWRVSDAPSLVKLIY